MQNVMNESGRSMVEMLGVLAIIGVLSVGGIAGYKTAMNRHQANQFMDLWHKANVERLAQMTANPKKVDVEFEQNGIRVAYGQARDDHSDSNPIGGAEWVISFDNINADVCKMIDDMTKNLDLFPAPEGGSTIHNGYVVDGMDSQGVSDGVFSECQKHSGSFSYEFYYNWDIYK